MIFYGVCLAELLQGDPVYVLDIPPPPRSWLLTLVCFRQARVEALELNDSERSTAVVEHLLRVGSFGKQVLTDRLTD